MRERFPTLPAALDEYLEDLALQARPGSARTYGRLLSPLRSLELFTHELNDVHCRKLAADRLSTGCAPATLQTFVYALRAFCGWCVGRGYMPANPALSVPKPRQQPPVHQYLSVEQVRALFAAGRDDVDRLAVMLMAGAGLRVNELCTLRVRDVDLERGLVRVMGKGGKVRELAPGAPTMALLARFLADRRQGRVLGIGTDAVRVRVRAMGQRAGLGRRIAPHQLRHSFAIHWLEASGEDALSLQQILGHADPTLTAYYVRSVRSAAALRKQLSVDLGGRLFSD